MEEPSSSSTWTREQEKAFENALAVHPEDFADRWELIAEAVKGKSVEDVKRHYELLVEDINGIESGLVPVPCYVSSSDSPAEYAGESSGGSKKGSHSHGDQGNGGKGSRAEQERRKGIAWTEEEHRLFLLGLDKYGKGDWRSISRNFVISRTPTQVASHAQKYFIRLNSMNKDRRRSSIHDITTVSNGESPPQGPITGQNNGPIPVPGKPATPPPPPPGPNSLPVYGQPVVGTPISLPSPGYAVRPPPPGAFVQGAPVNMAYSIPHAAHR
ncbi:duplicated homeodomain-like superfamily protein [Wolffia australiana]